MGLKNNILRIFSANFLSLISGILIGFILPIILPIDQYAYLKTYTFYISYIGILHFGFVDGMYIKYGGKNLIDLDREKVKLEHIIFTIFQSFITIICLIIAIAKNDIIMILFSISIIPMNTISFFSLIYQSVGDFKKYTKISYIYTSLFLLLNIILMIFNIKNYLLYCMVSIFANIIVFIYLELKFFYDYKDVKFKYDSNVFNNFKVGIFILVGNMSVMMFYAVDRWFIKLFYTVEDFAYYSFAISMLNIINVLVSSISVTLYNYLSRDKNIDKIKKLKIYFIILGVFSNLAYFVLAFIINIALTKYLPSLNIISISFASYPYMMVINALYLNLYKIEKDEKRYLKIVLIMVIISIIYNTIAMIISKNPISIAFATTLSFITWYFYSIRDFKYLKSSRKEKIYLSINLLSFLIFANFFDILIGGSLYFIIFIISTYIIFKNEVSEEIKILLNNKHNIK